MAADLFVHPLIPSKYILSVFYSAGVDWGMTLSQTGPWHRYLRRTFDSHLRPSLVHRYAIQQQRSAVLLLHELLQNSDDFMKKIR
jgi:hypothetical protein